MRLCLFANGNGRRVGIVADNGLVDAGERYRSIGAVLAEGREGLARCEELVAGGKRIPLAGIRLLPPVDDTTTVLAMAANYPTHAQEVAGRRPERPILFVKHTRSLVGHEEPILLSPLSGFLDYEAELAIVIGRPAWRVDPADALDHVGGYTAINDVSARDLQQTKLGDMTVIDFFSAKCLRATSPMGPWVVTADEVPDPSSLRVRLRLNGEEKQNELTAAMIYGIREMIAFASARLPLEPGDVIATGTPGGVGRYQDLKLQDGDVVETEITAIGVLRNPVRAER